MSADLKKAITTTFEISGLTLQGEASRYMQQVLETVPESEHRWWLNKIIDTLQGQLLKSPVIGKSQLEAALKEYTENTSDGNEQLTFVIDAFSVPAFTYNEESKKFVLRTSLMTSYSANLHSSAMQRTQIYLERYKLIHQRTMRHKLFAPVPMAGMGTSHETQVYKLQPVEYLLGTTSKHRNLIVLGMFCQIKEGKYYIEDPTGAVPLDLNQTTFRGGLFTENCFVLAEGWYEDGIFYVTALGFPPLEPSSLTLQYFGSVNFFGGSSKTSLRMSIKMKALEDMNPDAMFVFISDVWLDDMKVRHKLRTLFAGYSEMPPTCFVFMGNFVSMPKGRAHAQVTKECFTFLGNLISEFPTLVEQSKFVFVPSVTDAGVGHILPRPPIPDVLISDFKNKVPGAIFTTNPCRIQYCTQEIVVFREDMISKMCRNCVYMPWEKEQVDIPELFVKTLMANAHLCPLPMIVSPIYWEYDHAMWLYPLPDLVVCGDKHDPYSINSTNCMFVNPGSFPRTEFSFKVYVPATKQIEDSQVYDLASS